jgi:P63C domain
MIVTPGASTQYVLIMPDRSRIVNASIWVSEKMLACSFASITISYASIHVQGDSVMDRNESKAKGGFARAESLTSEQRKEIARKAAMARWEGEIPQASHEGTFEIGSATISAAVLPNHKRLLTQATFLRALGRSRSPKAGTGVLTTVDGIPFFLQADVLKPFISEELLASTTPIFFLDKKGRRMVGYDATLLPGVAEVYLKFRDDCAANKMPVPKQYSHIVAACDVVIRGLARVGIIAMVDEATGFQYDRPRRDLEEYLKKFLSESLVRWARTFPNDYFKHLCRLKGVELRPDMRLPQYFGNLTNDLVYRRIAPGLLKSLKERRAERGRPSNKLYWWTSEELGHPTLLLHLGTVVGLMKINTEYEKFYAQLNTVAPVYPEVPGLFDNPADWEMREEMAASK